MKKANRFLALVLALLLCMSMCASALADNTPASSSQIVNAGGTVYYDTKGNKHTSGTLGEDDIVVEMSKTIAGTDVENEFEITLQVKTKQDLRELQTLSPDAAVMLVLDVSNSMKRCIHCGEESDKNSDHRVTVYYCSEDRNETYVPNNKNDYKCQNCEKTSDEHIAASKCEFKSRMAAAQEAAKNFINEFANNTGAEEGDKRMVAIISFGSSAVRKLDWVDVHASKDNYDKAITAIDGLFVANDNPAIDNEEAAGGGTNIEAGLMLAKNNLNAGLASNGILNGISNLYTILLTDGTPTYNVANVSNKLDVIKGIAGGSDKTSKADVKDVGNEASAIRSLTSQSRLYSICFGKVITSEGKTEEVYNTKPFQNWQDANPSVSSKDTVGDWLMKFSNGAYNGEASASGLFDSFGNIIKLINIGAQAWLVEDSMGSHITNERVVTVYNAANNGSINNVTNVDSTNGKITWYLLQSEMDDNITTIKTNTDGTVDGEIGYTYKYKIKLDNLAAGHVADTEYNTNSTATLKYMVPDKDGNWPTEEKDLKSGEFVTPSVKSLTGNLTFTKVNESGVPLAGAEFKLALKNGNGWTTKPETSGSNGEVSFTDIPSGHSYTLSETIVPDGYQKMNDVDVSVSFGTVSDTGFTNTDGALTLINASKTGTITVTKLFDGLPENVRPASVTVTIIDTKGTDDTNDDTTAGTLTLSADGNWMATSKALPYGTYRFGEVSEAVGGYALTTAVFNQESVTIGDGNASVSVTLKNTYEQKTGTITVTKSFEGLPENVRPASVTVNIFDTKGTDDTNDDTTADTLTLSADGKWMATSEALPYGTYRFEESDADVNGYTLTNAKFASEFVTIDDNAPTMGASVELTNTYSQDVGSLIVNKGFGENSAYNADNWPEDKTITFTISRNDSISRTITLPESDTTPWSATVDNLPVGDYTVTEDEDEAQIDNYTLSVGNNGSKVTIAKDEEASTTITNTYSANNGSLKLKKTIDVDVGDANVTSVTLRVIEKETLSEIDRYELNAQNGWEHTILSIAPGTYLVEEIEQEYADNYYTVSTSWENQSVTVNPGQTAITGTNTVTCTNTYSLREATTIEIPVNKTVDYGEGGTVAPTGDRTFKFKMTIADDSDRFKAVVMPGGYAVSFNDEPLTPDEKGAYYFELTVDGIGTENGTLKIEALPDDLNCKKITITELGQTESGYEPDNRWSYDTTRFSVSTSLTEDGIIDLYYNADPQPEKWECESVDFVNLYTDVPPEVVDKLPKTGDNSRFALWAALAVLSAVGFACSMKRRSTHS